MYICIHTYLYIYVCVRTYTYIALDNKTALHAACDAGHEVCLYHMHFHTTKGEVLLDSNYIGLLYMFHI